MAAELTREDVARVAVIHPGHCNMRMGPGNRSCSCGGDELLQRVHERLTAPPAGLTPDEPLMCSEHEDRKAISYTARCRDCDRESRRAEAAGLTREEMHALLIDFHGSQEDPDPEAWSCYEDWKSTQEGARNKIRAALQGRPGGRTQ